VSGLTAARTDASPPATQQQPPTQPPPADPQQQQLHTVKLWPQVAALPPPASVGPKRHSQAAGGESEDEEALALAVVAQSAYGAGLAAAVTAPPVATAAQIGVLPSTMPAKLLLVYQVRGGGL